MSKSLVLTVDTVFNNPTAPYIKKYDPIENRFGSLFLWDGGLVQTTIPTSNSAISPIPNLLSEYSNGAMIFTKNSQGNQYAKSELSAKKGIHMIATQDLTLNWSSISFFEGLSLDATLNEKIVAALSKANPKIYFSIWTRQTRLGTQDSTSTSNATVFNFTASSQGRAMASLYTKARAMDIGWQAGLGLSLSKLDKTMREAGALANNNYQVLVGNYLGGTTLSMQLGVGMLRNQTQVAQKGDIPSFIVYRIYIEDLNASGRTFAEVKSIDDAEFEKAFAVGGRFYGDSWSDPASVLA
ncbi:hypothetical protein KTN00_15040 [Acinetobacter soli]|uniref:hypothetical protein n=1 Tax=Acinetobacter soli TaxID=487316 RepID=UPI001C4517A1|nr:hypothetical protein [Acinetobacter soli]MBV6552319.1 hypothetical protein [Acinetobacter soli]